MIFLGLCIYVVLNYGIVNAQCYINSGTSKTLCLSCGLNQNFDFPDSWPGGDVEFLTSECKYMALRPKIDIFISPNPCKVNSSCNGSISTPFDNIIRAFKFAWRSNASEMRFYLLSDMQENESSIHYINKADYLSEYQYIFRRYSADVYIQPLYCDIRNESGCLRNASIRPIIYIRTQSLYIFVTKNFFVSNIIFDASEINMEVQKLINKTNEKQRLCKEVELDGSLNPDGACNIRNRVSAATKFAYGLFNVETLLDCRACYTAVNSDKLIINNTDFRYFYSFGGGFSFGSIITVQRLRFSIVITACKFYRSMLPSGMLNSLPMPDYYNLMLNEYIVARDSAKERILKFDTCTFADYNYASMKNNVQGSDTFQFLYFSQVSFEITISNSTFFGMVDLESRSCLSILIYADVPEGDAKIVNYFYFYNNTFQGFNAKNILVFKKLAVYSGKRITVVLERNIFTNNTNFCFDLVLANVYFNFNTIYNHYLEACSLFQINFGNFTAYDNDIQKVIDKYSGAFIDFKGEQTMADDYIFENSILTNRSYQEGAIFERNTFIEMNLGIIRSNTTLVLLIFNKNVLQNIKNEKINITSGKVERDFIISNNQFGNIECSIMFHHEIFKNLSITNNSFYKVSVHAFLRAWLYSSAWPYSLIIISDNNLESILFKEWGFTFEPFYSETEMNFFISHNKFIHFSGSHSGCLFRLSFSTAILFENYFKQGMNTSLIQLKTLSYGDKQIFIENCLFEASAVFSLNFFISAVEFSFFLISNSSFLGNNQKNLGIALVYASSSSGVFDIINSEFSNLSASNAGALMIKVRDFSSLRILNCKFAYNKAPELGGDITLETIYKNSAFVRSDTHFITWFGVINNTFQGSQGGNGGSIRLLEGSQLVIRDNKFYNVSAQHGGTLYISQRCEVIFFENSIKLAISKNLGGSIYSIKSYLALLNCNIENSSSAQKGGVIYADNMVLAISFVSIDNSQSKIGGSIYCQSSTVTVNQLKSNDSIALNEGGSLYMNGGRLVLRGGYFSSRSLNSKGGSLLLDNLDLLNLINIVVYKSQSGADGLIYIYGNTDAIYKISNLTCRKNFATGLGDCLYVNDGNIIISTVVIYENRVKGCIFCFYGALRASSFSLKNVFIEGNNVESNTILVSGSRLKIVNVSVNNNPTGASFIFLLGVNSDVNIREISFYSKTTGTRFIRAEYTDMEVQNMVLKMNQNSGALHVVKCQSIIFRRLAIDRAFMVAESDSKGAGLYAEDSNIRLELTNVTRSRAKIAGAIFGIDTNLTLVGCLLHANSAENQVSSVYLLGENSNVGLTFIVIDCIFLNNFEIKTEGLDSLYIENIRLVINNYTNIENYAITIVECRMVILKGTKFQGMGSTDVGGMRIQSKETVTNVVIKGLSILNIRSKFSGAGVRLEGRIRAEIVESIFENNLSDESGGAIYIEGRDDGEQKISFIDCNFKNNSAKNSGMLLKTKGCLPYFIKKGVANNFSNFSEPQGDFSSYPSQILIVTGSDWEHQKIVKYVSQKEKQESLDLKEIVSGQPIQFTCAVFDHYGNLQMLNDKNKIKFLDPLPLSQALTIQNGVNIIQAGVAVFRDLIVVADPDSSIILGLNFYDELSERELNLNISLSVRNCIRGEIFTGRKCEVCPKNSYSLEEDPRGKNITACKACSPLAKCPGGDLLIPLQGYWKKDDNQTSIIQCLNEAACPDYFFNPQSNISEYKPKCGEKYWGNICANCEKGYGKTGSSDCKYCEMNFLFLFKYLLILFTSISMTSYQIHTAFSINDREVKHRCLMKLIANHFTFIGLLSRFKIDWESTTRSILNINHEYLTTIPSQIFYFDCFIDNFVSPDNKFIGNSILISLSPFFFGFFNLFFLYFIKLIFFLFGKMHKSSHKVHCNIPSKEPSSVKFNIKQDIIATCLIIFYNLYSKLLINVLSWIKCIKIDDSEFLYLESDPDILCWNRKHYMIIWSVTFPSFLVWIIIFPVLLLYSVYHVKRSLKLRKLPIGEKLFNFIALDYQEKYYYWDSFSFITKFLLVLCYMSTNSLKPASQGAFLILILLVLFLIQEKLKPYKYKFVNNLLSCSYIVTLCTGASAIIMSSEDLTDTHRLFFFVGFLGFNAFFYIAWLYCLFKEKPFIYNYFEKLSRGLYSRFGEFLKEGITRKTISISKKLSK